MEGQKDDLKCSEFNLKWASRQYQWSDTGNTT
jgi:hypothetical protein